MFTKLIRVIILWLLVNTACAQESQKFQSVNIQVTTHLGDQQVFVKDDLISFFISLDHGAYIYAFYQDAANSLFQILPGKAQAEHYFKAGLYIPFPSRNSAFQFQVQTPYGKEAIWVFASDNAQIVFPEKKHSGELKQPDINIAEIERRIKKASRSKFGSAMLVVRTQMKTEQ
jgi:Domain of unknown function (DUF4384)